MTAANLGGPKNPLYVLHERLKKEGHAIVDLVRGNVNEHGIVYPMPVWYEFQSRIAKVPSTSLAKKKLLERVNYFGQPSSIDAQGRVLIPAVLRNVAHIAEDVVVIGNNDHLIVWNEERIQKRLNESPMTAEDFKELELHGV